MADNTQLNAGTGGDVIATDDIGGIKHQRVKVQHGSDGVAQDAHAGAPLPIEVGNSQPKAWHDTAATLAAGGSTDLDGDQIGVGLTGYLAGFMISASVSLRAQLKTVQDGVESAAVVTVFSQAGSYAMVHLPSKRFVSVAHSATAGFDGFRLTVTNLDPSEAADVYAAFFYDEE